VGGKKTCSAVHSQSVQTAFSLRMSYQHFLNYDMLMFVSECATTLVIFASLLSIAFLTFHRHVLISAFFNFFYNILFHSSLKLSSHGYFLVLFFQILHFLYCFNIFPVLLTKI
jgi:hypothetical protein